MEDQQRHEKANWLKPFLCVLCLLILFCVDGLFQHHETLSLTDGRTIWSRSPSFWRALFSQTGCEIVYRNKSGATITNRFLEDSVSGLAVLIPAADGRRLYGLYYADVCFRLVKIDPDLQRKPFSKDSYLGYIIQESTCSVEAATLSDWREVSAYLKAVAPEAYKKEVLSTWVLGVWPSYYSRSTLMKEVALQITNMEHGAHD
jgi:hypothetical protein